MVLIALSSILQDDEFNFNHRRGRQSKNRAIYGVWAKNSDEEGADGDLDARPSFGGGNGRRKQWGASNYTTLLTAI